VSESTLDVDEAGCAGTIEGDALGAAEAWLLRA